MRTRSWPAVLLLIGVLIVGLAPRPRQLAAQPDEASGLHVIRAAYDILLDQFYRPLSPGELLYVGWDALTDQANDNALPAPPSLAPLPEGRAEAFAAFSTVYTDYVRSLPRDLRSTEVAFTVVDGMVRSVKEGHTFFLPPADYKSFLQQVGGDDVPIGLGITTSPQPPWLVRTVAPDGPAARAGLLPGDVIVTVDGKNVSRAAGREFFPALGGPEGTRRVLGIERGERKLELTVTRGPYYFPPLASSMLPDNIGYLRINSFPVSGVRLPNNTEFLDDLDWRLDELDAQGARALVLDLRGNPGGLVFTAAEVIGRFLPEDARTVINSDARGRQITGLAGGAGSVGRRRQLPMVVLVDRDSASTSEVLAAALRENDRALIVGERTGGVLATALIQPLPEDAGLSVAVAEVVTAIARLKIDEAGFPVDVEAPAPSGEDLRAGRDPQIDAAVAALANAPLPPAQRTSTTGLIPAHLAAMFARYMPDPEQVPRTDRLSRVVRLSTRNFDHVNQYINYNGPVRDPLALQAALRARGWLGSHVQEYGLGLLTPPSVNVIVDVYAGSAGAAEAIRTNDFPDLQERMPVPLQIGEDSVAYRGIWMAQGGLAISWRRGAVVFTVSYFDVPGLETADVAVAVARLVDEAYTKNPLPATQLRTGAGSAE